MQLPPRPQQRALALHMLVDTIRVYVADQSDRLRAGPDTEVDPPSPDRIAEPDRQPGVAQFVCEFRSPIVGRVIVGRRQGQGLLRVSEIVADDALG
jgi:hypothetical protein